MNPLYWTILALVLLVLVAFVVLTVHLERRFSKARALLPELMGDNEVACSSLRLKLRDAGIKFSLDEFHQFMSMMREERIVFAVGEQRILSGRAMTSHLTYILSPRGRGMLHQGFV